MRITFTRTAERRYATTAVRDDGVTVDVPSHDRVASLPHDLAHAVVERELALRQGFWGCVADGVLFPGMLVVAGRQPPRAAVRSRAVLRAAGQHGTEAEVLVGTLLHIAERRLDERWPAARAVLDDMWTPARPARPALTPGQVTRVCEALRAAMREWQRLPVGGTLALAWPTEARCHGRRRTRRCRLPRAAGA